MNGKGLNLRLPLELDVSIQRERIRDPFRPSIHQSTVTEYPGRRSFRFRDESSVDMNGKGAFFSHFRAFSSSMSHTRGLGQFQMFLFKLNRIYAVLRIVIPSYAWNSQEHPLSAEAQGPELGCAIVPCLVYSCMLTTVKERSLVISELFLRACRILGA
ncbi:uncharacterized protein J3R85_005187 [Psidium guajava]|nr:uncharacterized protein J3R85_005187 [Psidium guajava]